MNDLKKLKKLFEVHLLSVSSSCASLAFQVVLNQTNNDFYWRQKFSSLNVVQYNTTSRPIIIHL